MRTSIARQSDHTPVDRRLVVSALWIAMLFVFAYVDIFGFFRADVLDAALAGTVGATGFAVNQAFLTAALFYILPATLMVVASLLLRPRANRVVNLGVGALYIATIVWSVIGEEWAYYVIGSAVEVVLLLVIAGFAWRLPAPQAWARTKGSTASAPASLSS